VIRCYHRPPVRIVVTLLLILLAVARPARADRPAAPATIAVIPLQAERRLALYGAPVASELAGALTRAGFEVVLVSDVAVVPTRAWLVVDGRLITAGKAVAIELRIRDPEHAVDVARLAAQAPRLEAIDTATAAIATQLVAAIAEAEAAEAQLKLAAGDNWRHICEPPPVQVEAPTGAAAQLQPPKPEPPPPAPVERPRPRHFRAGVATLASGLALFAPVVGVLVYRHHGEDDLANLIAIVGDNEGTDAQQQFADSLRQRYRATTSAAAVLGTAGVALVVTGAVLLATGRERRPRVAVAPWGARGVGGLVLEGRF